MGSVVIVEGLSSEPHPASITIGKIDIKIGLILLLEKTCLTPKSLSLCTNEMLTLSIVFLAMFEKAIIKIFSFIYK